MRVIKIILGGITVIAAVIDGFARSPENVTYGEIVVSSLALICGIWLIVEGIKIRNK